MVTTPQIALLIDASLLPTSHNIPPERPPRTRRSARFPRPGKPFSSACIRVLTAIAGPGPRPCDKFKQRPHKRLTQKCVELMCISAIVFPNSTTQYTLTSGSSALGWTARKPLSLRRKISWPFNRLGSSYMLVMLGDADDRHWHGHHKH